MKRLALAAALAAPLGCAPASSGPGAECPRQAIAETVDIALPSGARVRAELADEPREREIGLMCRTGLAPEAGMLFGFDREMPLQFWMKRTLIPLDMVWLDKDKRVTGVAANVPASRVDTPDERVARAEGRGQWVLELAAGEAARLGLKKGDKLRFDAEAPSR